MPWPRPAGAGDYFGRGGLVFTPSTDGGCTFGKLRFPFALPVATGRVDVLMLVSEPGGTRFGRPVRVTSRAFDPRVGTQQGWIGDYQGLTATRGAFHPFWNDTRTGRMQLFTATVRPGCAG